MKSIEIGGIEFERSPSKVAPEIEKKIPADRLEISGVKQPSDRQTGTLPNVERDQQPVVGHQNRRHK